MESPSLPHPPDWLKALVNSGNPGNDMAIDDDSMGMGLLPLAATGEVSAQ